MGVGLILQSVMDYLGDMEEQPDLEVSDIDPSYQSHRLQKLPPSKRNLQSMIEDLFDKWVTIKGDELLGTYDKLSAALDEAYAKYGLDKPFSFGGLVKRNHHFPPGLRFK